MNHNSLVSVLMTAYNHDQYIVEAIESVLASTYKNFELIVVGDFSSDKTVEIPKVGGWNSTRSMFFFNKPILDKKNLS